MQSILQSIYTQNLQYSPRFETSYANHLSMAATAMFLLRKYVPIPDEKILNDAQLYSSQLTKKRVNSSYMPFDALIWDEQKNFLGNDDFLESWTSFFRNEVETDPLGAVAHWLRKLGRGLPASSGHAILRLAYAFLAKPHLSNDVFLDEITVGLGYLASHYCQLSNIESVNSALSLDDFMKTATPMAEDRLSILRRCQTIENRFVILKAWDEYLDANAKVDACMDISTVLETLAKISASNPNFTLLHCITVGHAILVLKDHLPDLDDTSLMLGYKEFVIATKLCESLEMKVEPKIEAKSEDIYKKIPQLIDDHSQKAAFTLLELHERFHSPYFLVSAESYTQAYG